MSASEPRSPTYEIQIHPAGAQGRIRYLRISRAELRALGVLAGLFVLFLLIGLGLAPVTLRSLLGSDRRAAAQSEHAQLERELRSVVSGLETLEARSRSLSLAARRFIIAYDLDVDTALFDVDGLSASEAARGNELEDARIDPLLQRARSLARGLETESSNVARALEATEIFQRTRPSLVASTPSIPPLAAGQYVVTSPFGERLNPFTRERETHGGLDLAAAVGTPVRVTADGVVRFAGLFGEGASTSSGWFRYGKLCIIEHDAGFATIYGHLAEIRTSAGRRVRRSEVLGTVGDTGWTTHPHLHYEVRRRRSGELRPADPRAFFLGMLTDEADRTPSSTDLAKVLLMGYEPLPNLPTMPRSP